MDRGGTNMKVNFDDVYIYNIALYVIRGNVNHGLKYVKDYK